MRARSCLIWLLVSFCVVVVVAGLSLVLLVQYFSQDLRPFLSQLTPGMSWQEAESRLNKTVFRHSYLIEDQVLLGTCVTSNNEMPYASMWISERMFDLEPEGATLYFTTNGSLMGIYYSAPPAREWSPGWGRQDYPWVHAPEELVRTWLVMAGVTNGVGAPERRCITTWPQPQ